MSGQYEKHVFVCSSGKICPRQGAQDVLTALRVRVKKAGLSDQIRINKSGCLSQCGHGPMVVVYPEDTWYAAVQATDVEVIFAEHLVGGQPVERLLYCPPGSGKQICPRGDEAIPQGDHDSR